MQDLQKSNLQRTNVLGVGISSLNMKEAVETLLEVRAKGQTGYVCVTGVHGVIESQRDPELKMIHNRSFLTVPDGMPTVWMGREQGFVHMGRVYGPDLMLRLMEATSETVGRGTWDLGREKHPTSEIEEGGKWNVGRGSEKHLTSNILHPTTNKKCYSHFLYGATEEMLAKLKENLESRFPGVRIIGTYAPPFRPLNEEEEKELRGMVAECKPDFFWVGLSTPKQERFMFAHSASMNVEGGKLDVECENNATSHISHPTAKFPLEAGIMLGVGAAFPIHAGLQKDAPEWIKNSGLQWFHRLCQEPKRLWRRYLDIVPAFLWFAALQLLGIKKYRLEE